MLEIVYFINRKYQQDQYPYLTPLNVSTGWMSSGKFSVSGHKKLSMIGIILHWESNAATISYKIDKIVKKNAKEF